MKSLSYVPLVSLIASRLLRRSTRPRAPQPACGRTRERRGLNMRTRSVKDKSVNVLNFFSTSAQEQHAARVYEKYKIPNC